LARVSECSAAAAVHTAVRLQSSLAIEINRFQRKEPALVVLQTVLNMCVVVRCFSVCSFVCCASFLLLLFDARLVWCGFFAPLAGSSSAASSDQRTSFARPLLNAPHRTKQRHTSNAARLDRKQRSHHAPHHTHAKHTTHTSHTRAIRLNPRNAATRRHTDATNRWGRRADPHDTLLTSAIPLVCCMLLPHCCCSCGCWLQAAHTQPLRFCSLRLH